MSTLNPPFRAEHVGSLLRPKALLDARERLEGNVYDEHRAAWPSTNYARWKTNV